MQGKPNYRLAVCMVDSLAGGSVCIKAGHIIESAVALLASHLSFSRHQWCSPCVSLAPHGTWYAPEGTAGGRVVMVAYPQPDDDADCDDSTDTRILDHNDDMIRCD